jgi:excisionase family DNA binding protein
MSYWRPISSTELTERHPSSNLDTRITQGLVDKERLAHLNLTSRMKSVRLRVEGTEDVVEIPEEALRILNDVLVEMAKGNACTIIPIGYEVTTQKAADILNVSRPFLIELLENKSIPHRKVGAHRRVTYEDVMNYKRDIDAKRIQALDELTRQAQERNLGY